MVDKFPRLSCLRNPPSVQATANTSVPPAWFFFDDTGYHMSSVKKASRLVTCMGGSGSVRDLQNAGNSCSTRLALRLPQRIPFVDSLIV